MSLLLGVVAGLAYGLSAFAGAFLALPLLVLVAGLSIYQSLPIALFALGICAAIAAGDAVRARQCDVQLAGLLILGSIPAALAAGVLTHWLSETVLATIFLIAAIVFGPLLLITVRSYRFRVAPPPATLLQAPRRGLMESVHGRGPSARQRLEVLAAGAGCGVLTALCAAPGSWIGWRALDRQHSSTPYLVVGTLAFAVAVLAIVESGLQFLYAPALPGYTAGLYVLGAVAGMGLARRIHGFLPLRASNTIIGVIIVIAAVALWITTVSQSAATP